MPITNLLKAAQYERNPPQYRIWKNSKVYTLSIQARRFWDGSLRLIYIQKYHHNHCYQLTLGNLLITTTSITSTIILWLSLNPDHCRHYHHHYCPWYKASSDTPQFHLVHLSIVLEWFGTKIQDGKNHKSTRDHLIASETFWYCCLIIHLEKTET